MTKPFVKGDPRINRKGRPKSFDALRQLAQQIAHEVAQAKGGGPLTNDNGQAVTIAEAILRQWAASGDARKQQAFIEYAFGKVPQVINGDNEGGAVKVEYVNAPYPTTCPTPGAGTDIPESSEV